jgi:hypothetical protein
VCRQRLAWTSTILSAALRTGQQARAGAVNVFEGNTEAALEFLANVVKKAKLDFPTQLRDEIYTLTNKLAALKIRK